MKLFNKFKSKDSEVNLETKSPIMPLTEDEIILVAGGNSGLPFDETSDDDPITIPTGKGGGNSNGEGQGGW